MGPPGRRVLAGELEPGVRTALAARCGAPGQGRWESGPEGALGPGRPFKLARAPRGVPAPRHVRPDARLHASAPPGGSDPAAAASPHSQPAGPGRRGSSARKPKLSKALARHRRQR
jgi:hypothetical protein